MQPRSVPLTSIPWPAPEGRISVKSNQQLACYQHGAIRLRVSPAIQSVYPPRTSVRRFWRFCRFSQKMNSLLGFNRLDGSIPACASSDSYAPCFERRIEPPARPFETFRKKSCAERCAGSSKRHLATRLIRLDCRSAPDMARVGRFFA